VQVPAVAAVVQPPVVAENTRSAQADGSYEPSLPRALHCDELHAHDPVRLALDRAPSYPLPTNERVWRIQKVEIRKK